MLYESKFCRACLILVCYLIVFYNGFVSQINIYSLDLFPKANVQMKWFPLFGYYEGRAFFERNSTEKDLEIILYPNRYLKTEGNSDRELDEAYSSGPLGEDKNALKRRGALVVSSVVKVLTSGTSCKAPNFEEKANSDSQPVDMIFNKFETILTLRDTSEYLPKKCEFYAIKFRFTPPNSEGNFGIKDDGSQIYSGPIYPISRNVFYDYNVSFINRKVTCARCMRVQNGSALNFRFFPPPLHIFEPNLNSNQKMTFSVGSVHFEFLGTRNDIRQDIENLSIQALKNFPFIKDISKINTPIIIDSSALLHRVSLRMQDEIQLGIGFLKTNPITQKYHEAAFIRSLNTELWFRLISEKIEIKNARDFGFVTTISRHLAEKLMQVQFEKIDDIKNLSEKFKFFPVFREIFEGKALVNNEVFLGREESAGKLDTSPLQAIFPTFSATELNERANWCLTESQLGEFNLLTHDTVTGIATVENFILKLQTFESEKCKDLWKGFLHQRTIQERIEASPFLTDDSVVKSYALKRSRDKNSPEQIFAKLENQIADSVTIKIVADDKILYKDNSSVTGDFLVIKLPQADQNSSLELLGPSTETNRDKYNYPRKIEFVMTGVKLRYESAEKNINLQQQFQFNMRGDEWGRSFGLMWRKQKNLYMVQESFSGLFNQFGVYLPKKIYENFSAERMPKFPFTLGFNQQFENTRREMWSFAEISVQNSSVSILAPEGYEAKLLTSRSLWRKGAFEPIYRVESEYSLMLPIAKLTTLKSKSRLGKASEKIELGGSSGVPGFQLDDLVSDKYAIFRNELSGVVAHDLSLNLGAGAIVEHVFCYVAHHSAFDAGAISLLKQPAHSIQSLETGIRIYGSLFGAKNQSVTFDWTRTLGSSPRNGFGVTVGKN